MASPNLAATELTTAIPEKPARSPFAAWDAAILYGTFALLLLGPLWFGAVEPWAIFVLQCGATLLLLAWAARQIVAKKIAAIWNPLFPPICAFAGVIVLQIALGTSAYRHATISASLLYVVYAALVFLVAQSVRTAAQVRRLAWVLTAYGAGVALFALVQDLSSKGKLYWIRTPRSGGWIYGPYVNHNHYAGLMEMLFPVALVTALTRHVRGRWKIFPASAAVLMASTIFLSGSRGGMVGFVAEMVLLGAFIAGQKNRRAALTVGVVLTIVACLMLWVGGEALLSRIGSIQTETKVELDGGLRFTINRDGLKMAAKKPILGWGLGTFPTVYPQFRSFYTEKFINQAHDDYLQALVETGILGFAVIVWFLVLVFRHGLRKLGDWTVDYNGTVAAAALLGCTGILIHSFVDFNLQIPANAALFYTFAVLAAAPTQFITARRVRRRRSQTENGEEPVAELAPLFAPNE